ncbi:hypothetical protein CLU96_3821 [Chryseobacterium sp. 52]|nr:hypothetical protein CLU96_3821 [Chryseobacterium sp. 52]
MNRYLGFGNTKVGNFQILHFPDKKHMDFSNTSKTPDNHRPAIPFFGKVINLRFNGIMYRNYSFLSPIIFNTSCLNRPL